MFNEEILSINGFAGKGDHREFYMHDYRWSGAR